MKQTNFDGWVVFDAKNKVLGRLASTVAKELLKGKSIVVVNAELAYITGSKNVLIEKYRTRLNLQEKENPEHSPYWSRRPDMLVRRVIRGMLPYHKKPSGKAAYRRLRVFSGVPSFVAKIKPVEFSTNEPDTMYVKYLYVRELSKLLGYTRE
jgi:large subunit ribosomal protein L13